MSDLQMVQTKSIFASRTFWFNVISAGVLAGQELLGANVLPVQYQLYGTNAVNLLLRLMTTQPVTVG